MSQNITLLGASYSNVPSVSLPKTGGGTAKFSDASITTATASDVASGKKFLLADGSEGTGTASGGGGNDFVITVSWNSSTELWEPDCTFAEVQAAYAAGKNIVVDASGASEDATADGEYDSSNSRLRYWVHQYDGDAGVYETPYDFNTSGATRHSPTVHYITPQGTKQITANGQGIDVTEYAAVDVAVPTGTPRTSTDLTVSGDTVTAPAGYYASAAFKAVSSGTATAPASISGTAATVSTGTNTLTLSKTISVTPQVSAGYVSSGTAGNSSVSLTASVTTQAAQTIHPSTTQQTIASGRYLTGTQTIAPVTTTNLTADNIKSGVTVKIGDASDDDRVASVTGTYSGGGGTDRLVLINTTSIGTLSTTSTSGVNSNVTVSLNSATNWDDYDLLIVDCSVNSPTNGRHTSTVSMVLLTGTSSVGTKNTYTVVSNKWNTKLSSTGTASSRQSTTAYGVYVNSASVSSSTLSLPIYYKYNNNSTGTLNGTYTARVYGVKLIDLIGG